MIHESVMEEILKHGGVVRPAEITLLHKGYAASSEEIQKKKDRNLEVLLRQAGHSPEDFYTVLKLGETHLAMDHLPEAEEAIQRGLGLLNAGKVAARDTARVAQLFILKTLLHSKQKNFRDAEIAAQQSLRIAPHQSIAHSLLSHMYEEQGRHSEAIAELRYLLEARSTSKGLSLEADVQSRREELLFRLARLLALSQDRSGAKEALVRSRDANPGYLPTLVSLSGMFVEDGNMAEALSCLDSAIRVSPREPKLHVLHAQVLLSLQRRDEAVDHLQQCFSLGILSEEGLTLLVKLLAESTSQIDAIPYLRRLTELRPSAVDVRFSLVQGLIAKEHFSEALRELEVALSLSPREPLNGMFVALKSQLEAYLHAHASGSM
jgi:tetratricopeptide (TPR) repeat protein